MQLQAAGEPLPASAPSPSQRKALVYVPTGEMMASLGALERRLAAHGWERYYENRAVVQLHRRDGGADLIAQPRDFAAVFRSTHMYVIVVKNRDLFRSSTSQGQGQLTADRSVSIIAA
ncbi:Flowering-promoting factor 1-like protein 5 [Dichanthelium oligosanthes]|uniref:Flowering-promoting factor 1-like protein 5 n=1 Tax=Dichanthelium oligosanthes TaxID=888268 RepID=A0A1E5W4L2_9POAL|nr:Flowering-promoting factor 1-like protein 5 [Dichanthelium oligosanthes]